MANKEALFKSWINENDKSIRIIELNKFVLGGNEALEFVAQLDEFSKQNVRCVIIDLANVEMMNSSGLGMLVNGLRNLRKHDVSLKLSSLTPKVNNLLRITRLDEVFNIYDNIELAIKNCK